MWCTSWGSIFSLPTPKSYFQYLTTIITIITITITITITIDIDIN